MRILELFAGYGSQALALENLGIEFTSDISEIDKYAIQAYNQLHGDTHNWGDITKIDEKDLPYYDLITYSSPCQDFSVAGLQRGGDKDSGTRSSLLWECERIIRAVKPKYLLMENVKNLVGEKHKHNFIKWLKVLESIGYKNWWKVLNAKDYGVPQNRERVFVVSILGCGQYLFPNPIKLEKRLKDVLEPVVDEKYYLSDKVTKQFAEKLSSKEVNNTIRCGGRGSTDQNHSWDIVCVGGMQEHQSITTDGTSTCLTSSMVSGGGYVPMIVASRGRENGQELEFNESGCSNALTSVQKDNLVAEPQVINPLQGKTEYGWHFEQEVFDSSGLTRAVKAGGGSGNIPKVIEEPYNLYPNSGNPQAGRVYNPNGISPAMDTCSGGNRMPKIVDMFNPYNNSKIEDVAPTQTSQCDHKTTSSTVLVKYDNYRIRKLTPRECWRLMGVQDEQFNKLHDISNTQLYKLAGNSIVVDVLMGIFKNLLVSNEGTKGQLTLL